MEQVPLADRRNLHVGHIVIPMQPAAPIKPLAAAGAADGWRSRSPQLRLFLVACAGLMLMSWAVAQGMRAAAPYRGMHASDGTDPYAGVGLEAYAQ